MIIQRSMDNFEKPVGVQGYFWLASFCTNSRIIWINNKEMYFKVHIFREGHKLLQNLHLTFDYSTLSVLRIFVHFHLLSFAVIYHKRVVLTHNFFREIATFTSKLLTFNKFLSSSMIFVINFFFLTFKMRLMAPECVKVCLELDL